MTSRQIEIFIRLAGNLSFAKTAEELYTTQPTITRELRNLENEIGVALFKRDRHNVEITPAGASFLVEAKRIHVSMQRAVAIAREDQATFEEHLHIGFCHEASVTELWKALREFHVRYPKVRIRLVSDSLSKLQRLFEEGNLDVVFGMKAHLTPGKKDGFSLLYRGFWVAVLANDHPLSGKQELRFEDLNGHTILAWNPVEYPQRQDKSFEMLRTVCPDCKYNYFNNLTEMGVMAKAGFGISILPQYSVHPSREYRIIPLVFPSETGSQGEMDYYAMWHKNRPQSHAVELVEIMNGYYQ